ncbi:MAG TPA: hypothetical protein VLA93_19910 [Pyrinomonadaceae bacterium]|nr:hypothetical protein [Pyrinomonadaceae bacterium]
MRAKILLATLVLLLTLACNWRSSGNTNVTLAARSRTEDPSQRRSGQPSPPRQLTDADYTRHANDLHTRIRQKLRSNEFSIVIQKPFVVVGDEGPALVQQRANDTVKWAVDLLKQDFFTKDPNEILEIWLFRDDASYRNNARLMFGDTPSTPYGYYSRAHKALIMNIGTGGGTLVHEIVHPFVESNFPACPSWLNEGLGSLYEQCGQENGHIHGYTNWRLPGLQRAIRENRVPKFKTLLETTSQEFYDDTTGLHYAQSRYLCYYLQQNGLLVKFYQHFLKNQADDPSGFKSLQTVLGETDIEAFQTRWEKYVLGLRQGFEVTIQ